MECVLCLHHIIMSQEETCNLHATCNLQPATCNHQHDHFRLMCVVWSPMPQPWIGLEGASWPGAQQSHIYVINIVVEKCISYYIHGASAVPIVFTTSALLMTTLPSKGGKKWKKTNAWCHGFVTGHNSSVPQTTNESCNHQPARSFSYLVSAIFFEYRKLFNLYNRKSRYGCRDVGQGHNQSCNKEGRSKSRIRSSARPHVKI